MSNFVQDVKEFNRIAGTEEVFDVRKSALYTGLIFEELSEMIESLNCKEAAWLDLVVYLSEIGDKFKQGAYDQAFHNVNRVEYLDAAVDIAVVSLGAGIAIGGDIEGACNAVSENNLSKFPIVDGVRTVLRDENGKIKKPEGFKSVELSSYVK